MRISVFCAVLYSLIFLLVYFSVIKDRQNGVLKKDSFKNYSVFYIVLGIIFAAELITTSFSKGYINDTLLFKSWASFGERHHIWEYYITEEYVDYPPAYLNVLFVIGKIASVLGVNSNSPLYLCFVRFVPIAFDMVCSIFIFRFAKARVGGKVAVTLALFSALNPINILNSTVWGQIDSIVVMLVCIMLWLLYKRKYALAMALFTLAELTKPQMIIYVPLLGFTILSDFFGIVKEREEGIKMMKQIGMGLVLSVFVVLIVPLAVTGGNYALIIENYKQALGLYPYATLCAPNLYGAFGANWMPDSEIFLSFSYKTWGFIFITVMSAVVGLVSFKVKDRTKIFCLGAFTVLTIFMFAHGMHERYAHALLMILLIIYVIKQKPGFLVLYLAFSVSSFINCTQVMLALQNNVYIYGDNPLFIANSWINILIYIFMVYVLFVSLFSGNNFYNDNRKKEIR